MAKTRKAAEPRRPDKTYGPFPGGCGLSVWTNEVETDQGTRFFRSVTIKPRRYRDKKTGAWKDSKSLRPTDLPSLVLALEAAQQYMASTPLPGEAADIDDMEVLEDGEIVSEPPM